MVNVEAVVNKYKSNLSNLEKLNICQAIIIDLLNGKNKWYDIKSDTGLSTKRCKEIERNYLHILTEYEERHNIM